jgi:hypothetical protein
MDKERRKVLNAAVTVTTGSTRRTTWRQGFAFAGVVGVGSGQGTAMPLRHQTRGRLRAALPGAAAPEGAAEEDEPWGKPEPEPEPEEPDY